MRASTSAALARLGPRRAKADSTGTRAVRFGNLRRSEPMRHWLGAAAARPCASCCHRRRRPATRLYPAARHRTGPKPNVGAAATPDGDGAVRAEPQEPVRSRSVHPGRARSDAARPIPLRRRYRCLHQPGLLRRQASGRCRPRRTARADDHTSRPPLDARRELDPASLIAAARALCPATRTVRPAALGWPAPPRTKADPTPARRNLVRPPAR